MATTSRAQARPAAASRKLTGAEKKAARGAKRAQRARDLSQPPAGVHADPRERPAVPAVPDHGRRSSAAAVVYAHRLPASPSSPYFADPARGRWSASLAAMLVFCRRAQRSMFAQAEGQPGAAGWMLQQQLRGDWRLTQAVAGTTQLDAVHRLVGRPGVVLVGEGAPHRVRGPARAGEEDDRPGRRRHPDLRRHRRHRRGRRPRWQAEPLPDEAAAQPVARSRSARWRSGSPRSAAAAPPLPQGPMPQGAKMRNVQRTVRRRVAEPCDGTGDRPQAYRGERLGLPAAGPGSLAPTGAAAGRVPRRRARVRRWSRPCSSRTTAARTCRRPAARLVEPDPARRRLRRRHAARRPDARACTCSGCGWSGSTARRRRSDPPARRRPHRAAVPAGPGRDLRPGRPRAARPAHRHRGRAGVSACDMRQARGRGNVAETLGIPAGNRMCLAFAAPILFTEDGCSPAPTRS